MSNGQRQLYAQALARLGIEVAERSNTYTVRCSCGSSSSRTFGTAWPPEVVSRKFKQAGWAVHGKTWTCPERQRHSQPKKTIEEIVVQPSRAQVTTLATAIQADKPQAPRIEPTLKEARAIMDLIEAHFIEKDGRYKDGWSDDKIAQALDLPRAMITKVRDEAYGPLKAPTELLNLRAEIDTTANMVADLKKRVETALASFGIR